jgi:hypothetical protein
VVSNKAVRQALYQKLNVASVTGLLANGSASLYHAVAPQTAAFPLLVFSKQAGTQVNVFGDEAYQEKLWLVKAIARGTSSSVAEDIDKAVFDLLNFGTLTITGATTMFVARESDVEFVETSGDTQYRHVGGIYRVTYQDA